MALLLNPCDNKLKLEMVNLLIKYGCDVNSINMRDVNMGLKYTKSLIIND